MNSARSSFSAGSSAMTARFERNGGRDARLGQAQRLAVVSIARAGGLLLERAQPLLAGIEIGEVGGMESRSCGEVVDRHGILARRGAQRKQPLLGAFQQLRVELARPHRRLDRGLRRVERDQAAIDRL